MNHELFIARCHVTRCCYVIQYTIKKLKKVHSLMGCFLALQNHIRTSVEQVPWSYILDHRGCPFKACRRCPKTVGRGLNLALYVGQYGDVLMALYQDVVRTLVEGVLRMSDRDVPQRYVEGHMGTSTGRLSVTSSGRPRHVNLLSEQYPSRLNLMAFQYVFLNRYFRLQNQK